jgi:hypothetical protein
LYSVLGGEHTGRVDGGNSLRTVLTEGLQGGASLEKKSQVVEQKRIPFATVVASDFSRILKLSVWLSSVSREGQANEARRSSPRKVHMSKIQVYRSLIVAAVIGAVWYLAVLSQAAELRPMVVVGIPANSMP